jgi:hypothetical protein
MRQSWSVAMRLKLAAIVVSAGLCLVALPAAAQYMDLSTIVMNVGSVDFLRGVEVVSEASSVRVQRLSTLNPRTSTASWVAEQLSGKERNIRYLQSSVAQNPIAMTAVRNSKVSLDQIVGVEALGKNAAVIYANDL